MKRIQCLQQPIKNESFAHNDAHKLNLFVFTLPKVSVLVVLISKLIYLKNQELHIKCLLKEITISSINYARKLFQAWSVSNRSVSN